MLRARLSRKALWGAVAIATAALPERQKLSIYPQPEDQLVLINQPTELERQIGKVRERVTGTYKDSYAYVQSWVDRWIATEQAIERRVKSFKAPDEQLTPAILYVGVATLSGSILARSRGLPSRIFLPPTLFLLSLNHFLPKTASNIGEYTSDLEHTYAPRAAQFTDTAVAHSQMSWEMLKDKTRDGREGLERGVMKGVGAIQEATGLKLREALGLSNEVGKDLKQKSLSAFQAAEEKAKTALHAAEEKGKELAGKAEKKDVAEKKAEQTKRLV